ncbi:MAG: hypothetical protein HRU20_07415 [Pseudomonadales bacterium]|nr:hypothetical protein [Pseudomonadales bacterium]
MAINGAFVYTADSATEECSEAIKEISGAVALLTNGDYEAIDYEPDDIHWEWHTVEQELLNKGKDIRSGVLEVIQTENKAYEYGECQIDKEMQASNRGDGLAHFIRQELIESTEGEDGSDISDRAISAMITAHVQIQKVISALENKA